MGLASMAIIAVVAVALFLVLERFLELGAERDLAALVDRVEVELEQDHEPLEFDDGFPRAVHVRLLVRGEVVAATPDFPEIPRNLAEGYSVAADHQVLVTSGREDGTDFVLQLATDATIIGRPLAAFLQALAVILPLAALLVALISSVTAGHMIAPLERLERAAHEVGERAGSPGPLPGECRGDEIGRLARTLSSAFRRLADALEREQAFTRAAAHDLRSPLTALRTRIQSTLAHPRDDAGYRTTLRELDRDVTRLSLLTEHLLLLARDGHAFEPSPVDLPTLAADAVERARMRHPEASIEVAGSHSATVRGDATLLVHLLDNLLENAVVHGGGADVVAKVEPSAGGVVALSVRDAGPGVTVADLPHLGEAFYRPGSARGGGGSGLGLATVRRLAELHGAETSFMSAPGEGFVAEVTFPPVGATAMREGAAAAKRRPASSPVPPTQPR